MITPVLEKDHSGGSEGTDGEGTTLEAGKALITTAIVRAISTMASLRGVETTGRESHRRNGHQRHISLVLFHFHWPRAGVGA